MMKRCSTAGAAQPERTVALAGNPNVGKSTVFNALTHAHQHTGNWPGKTVGCAAGMYTSGRQTYTLIDIPGAYSLLAHSAEEEIARNFVCFHAPDAVIVVCDATCLVRNLNLALQILETTDRVVICVNLMDEARRKGVSIDLPLLSRRLGVPVVGTVAQKKQSLTPLKNAVDAVVRTAESKQRIHVTYPAPIEEAAALVEDALRTIPTLSINARWLSLQLLAPDASLIGELKKLPCGACLKNAEVARALDAAHALLRSHGLTSDGVQDLLVTALIRRAEAVCRGAIRYQTQSYDAFDRRIDRILTSRWAGYPLMALMLTVILWLTITGANVPSALLSDALNTLSCRIGTWLHALSAPPWLTGMLVDGVLRVLFWVVSVMLPPMAIFFPLFTLLEDAGYLPRVAFNLDRPFKQCCACGKQALTMCMGFGCNAVGVTGCRIIDSPRERLLAILTNCFIPCNGRFAPPQQGKESCFRRLKNRTRKSNFP